MRTPVRVRTLGNAGEQGQMLVTVALLSTVLFILAAIATETSLIWVERRNLQNAADAAALAGAQRLPSDPSAAIADAEAWARKNVPSLLSVEAQVFDSNRAIRVTVRRPAATVFGNWFGYGGFTISARAAARVAQPLLPGPGVVPLAVSQQAFQEALQCGKSGNETCPSITLKEWSGNNDDPRSSYQLVDIDGRGVSGLEAGLVGGSQNPITDPVDQQTGNTGRSLADGLARRMAAATANGCLSWSQVVDSSGSLNPRCDPLGAAGRGTLPAYPDAQPTAVIVIPVVTSFCQGSCDLDIVGSGEEPRRFAYFWIDWGATQPRCGAPGSGGQGSGGQGSGGQGGGGGGGGRPPGQCEIVGRFILQHEAQISTYVSPGLGDFDENALLKVIQLIE
ncbi:MAG: pilus assembly protein TadG-related protein [Chloroflexota bacterium]|nr:pilus assembly protein TadG-related protein [Dehalococcoidia bacterium]MDW8045851.1 pilus assembly protein TadG-related protein [Chloroflexota bacterium]